MSLPVPAAALQAASLLLSYPDEELLDRVPELRRAVDAAGCLPAFAPLLDHLAATELRTAQEQHVQEFDISRRHALHLSYWTDGDTRRRGEVLAGIKQVFRDSGLVCDLAGELPDHLPVVLEFAALGDPQRGWQLLVDYQPSLEMLRLALTRDGLPHAGVIEWLCEALPAPSPRDAAGVQAMLPAPPVETVGLDPYDPRPTEPGHPALSGQGPRA